MHGAQFGTCALWADNVVGAFVQVIEEQHTFLDRQVALLRCSVEQLTDDDKVRVIGAAGDGLAARWWRGERELSRGRRERGIVGVV